MPKNKIARLQPLPMVVIRWYQSRLASVVAEWQAMTKIRLSNGIITDMTEQFKTDDALDDFNRLTVTLQDDFNSTMPDVERYATDAYGRTDAIHKKRWSEIVAQTYGVSPFLLEDWQNGFLRSFVTDNVSLMKNASEDMVKKITQTVIDGAKSGVRPSEIAKRINKDFKTTKKHARFIARDQVSKLYGQINRMRQTDIGVSRYIWSDSDDDRVRPTHSANDDKIMRWDNNNVYLDNGRWVTRTGFKGIPGEDFQCRCVALGILPDVIGG
jgi:SPP1 gp7 family putative phage head morphogenesis protein